MSDTWNISDLEARIEFACRIASCISQQAFLELTFQKRQELFQHFLAGRIIIIRIKQLDPADPDECAYFISIFDPKKL